MMLGVSIILIASLSMLCPIYLCYRKQLVLESTFLICMGSFVLIMLGTILILANASPIESRFSAKKWPTIQGTVIQSEITGERSFMPQVTLEYSVKEKNTV